MNHRKWPEYPLCLLSPPLQRELQQALSFNGQIATDLSERACRQLAVSFEQWMILLLPLAAHFACAPVSHFSVGAIAAGQGNHRSHFAPLYFGSNYEFLNLPLNFSVHAEQSAISNAWSQGETHIQKMAISAAPCGHCRQFLNELAYRQNLLFIFPDFDFKLISQRAFDANLIEYKTSSLSQLLPDAFGPADLGNSQGLMAEASALMKLSGSNGNVFTPEAQIADAAKSSYAPYSGNLAACGIVLKNGQLIISRYAENAAYNPALYPFPAALCQLNFRQVDGLQQIERVILVEKPSKVSQRSQAQSIIASVRLDLDLECYQFDEICGSINPQ